MMYDTIEEAQAAADAERETSAFTSWSGVYRTPEGKYEFVNLMTDAYFIRQEIELGWVMVSERNRKRYMWIPSRRMSQKLHDRLGL